MEVNCIAQDHVWGQWPTVIGKGPSAPEPHSFWATQGKALGKYGWVCLLVPWEPGCLLRPLSRILKPLEKKVTSTGPSLGISSYCLLPQPEGDDRASPGPVWWGGYRRPGLPFPVLITLPANWRLSTILKKAKRDKKPNKVGPEASWNDVVFCPVAGDPVTDACDYGLCKQLSEKFIRFPKAAEEQMWN